MLAPVCASLEVEMQGSRPASPGLGWWNAFVVLACGLLALVDQDGPLGYASRWFFCALAFAGIKAGVERLGFQVAGQVSPHGAIAEGVKWFVCALIFAALGSFKLS